MNSHKSRSRVIAAAVGLATAVTLGLGAPPASAKASDGWVRGYDFHVDDLNDEGTLAKGPENFGYSNATCFWQKILWAEGAKWHSADGWVPFKISMIDGVFGTNTNNATQNLQSSWHIGVDGKVGNETFGKAHIHMFKTGGSYDRGKVLNLEYRGTAHSFKLFRNAEGKYTFKDRKGDWRQAGYNYRTCG
ncbi:Tat pathway signal protein [Streptomyces tendae]|uniref:peptidoglycan-binding domain-containing protein n=1 Tax=Streptomyces tendae TaxID=1932 RepID=UPI003411C6F1